MIADFRISHSPPSSIILNGSNVECVSSYKYLGIMMDNKLAWHDHINYLTKRLNVRMYCFRKLNYFHVDKRFLAMFYMSIEFSFVNVATSGTSTKLTDFANHIF